jgi:hypothetical protein
MARSPPLQPAGAPAAVVANTKRNDGSAVNLHLGRKPVFAKRSGNMEAFPSLSLSSEKDSSFKSVDRFDHGQLAERVPWGNWATPAAYT